MTIIAVCVVNANGSERRKMEEVLDRKILVKEGSRSLETGGICWNE